MSEVDRDREKEPFKIEEWEFENELSAKRWIIKNQFSRRNLTLDVRLDLAFQYEILEKEEAEMRKLSHLKQCKRQN